MVTWPSSTVFSKDEEIWIENESIEMRFLCWCMGFLRIRGAQKSMEINQNKAKAIDDLKPHSIKKQLQSFLGKINFLRRFISNLSGKVQSFSPLLRLKKDNKFIWGSEQ